MHFDLSTIIYVVLLLLAVGIMVRVGGVVIALVLTGVSVVALVFALLVIADFLTGGDALKQIANAAAPIVASIVALIAAWIKTITMPSESNKYD